MITKKRIFAAIIVIVLLMIFVATATNRHVEYQPSEITDKNGNKVAPIPKEHWGKTKNIGHEDYEY
jgi:uncharacterized membrane protein